MEALPSQSTVRKTAGKLAFDLSTAPLRLVYNKVASKMRIPRKNSDKNKHTACNISIFTFQFIFNYQQPSAA